MNYYQVEAKCGHVGMNNYIIKRFYVCADNGKEAAFRVRKMPRVKHHHKDAIRNVTAISYDEYIEGIALRNEDPYFHVSNSSDQRLFCDIEDDILKEEKENGFRKATHAKKRLIELLTVKEWKSGRNYAYE